MPNFIKTELEGVVIIEPKVFDDNRGYFFESYNKASLLEKIGAVDFIQDNGSKSSYGVLRDCIIRFHPLPNRNW